MAFLDEFNDEKDRAVEATKEVTRVAAIEMVNFVILQSAVGNPDLWMSDYVPEGYVGGRFRSNWFLTQYTPSVKMDDDIKNPQSMISSYTQRIVGKYSDSWILTNNLPYAEPLDNGHSSQMPTGITEPAALYVNARIPEIQRAADRKFGVS